SLASLSPRYLQQQGIALRCLGSPSTPLGIFPMHRCFQGHELTR
ncbi:hypothetical protein D046_8505, partial [Vibrio parahaemolyticus V-223/04]